MRIEEMLADALASIRRVRADPRMQISRDPVESIVCSERSPPCAYRG